MCLCVNDIVFLFFVFFFNDTATTEIYTLSLHDALPIWGCALRLAEQVRRVVAEKLEGRAGLLGDRKSTRLNSSHSQISYAVFCLKKKKNYTHVNKRRQDQSSPTPLRCHVL